MTNSLKDLKARLSQCNLMSEDARRLLRSHLLGEKESLGAAKDSLGGCLDAAVLLLDSTRVVEEREVTEIQDLLGRILDVVAEGFERRTPPDAPERSVHSTGVGILNHMALGQVLVELGMTSKEVVQAALGEAATSGVPLGQVLVKRGAVTAEDIENAAALQKTLAAHAPKEAGKEDAHVVHRVLLGELLIQQGTIERTELERGLELQRRAGIRLGEALIQLSLLNPAQLESAVALQAR